MEYRWLVDFAILTSSTICLDDVLPKVLLFPLKPPVSPCAFEDER
jgi:hypothetical protein